MPGFTYDLTDNPRDEDSEAISAILRADTADKKVEARKVDPFAVFIRNENRQILGGITGHTVWNWLYIERLGVSADLRGQGIAKQLVKAAEEMAIRRGCLHAHVSTGSYQVPGFYASLGYQEYARLPDHPKGHAFVHLMKRLEK